MAQNQNAACYLRSSKDRGDVSIDSQRRELRKFAADRGLVIVQEYTDVVESAKDAYRSGFQQMLRDLKSTERAWYTLLLVDTSRLSRRRYVAQVFKHEARKRGVDILYSKVPEVDPITGVVLEAVFEAFDEVHSLMSREKGLAGMAENVRRGFRAGGRAPRGYRLRAIATDVYREGEQVVKSVLEVSEDAPRVARYLTARAAGLSRAALRAEIELPWSETTLIGMEWNAVTYAGHTVWNVHNEYERGSGYKGGKKRRAREQWVIHRDTHSALITDGEAEAILAQLENSKHGKRRTAATYLLTGLLQAPDGAQWSGNGGGRYRVKEYRRNVSQEAVEAAVIGQVTADMQSTKFIGQLAAEAKRYAMEHDEDPAADLRQQVAAITGRIGRMVDLAADLEDPAPTLRKIDELERQRKALVAELANAERDYASAQLLREVDDNQVRGILNDVLCEMAAMDREPLKDLLGSLIDKIVLDPSNLECQIHYRIGVRNKVASPRGCPAIPILRAISTLRIA